MAAGGIPNDLDILDACDQVFVKQRPSEWFTAKNRYEVRTMEDQVLFKMKDEGNIRLFMNNVNLIAYDTQDVKVFSLRRPATWKRKKIEVSVMDQVVAVIRQESTYMKPVLYINDPEDRHILRIKGDIRNLKFLIQTMEKETIGSIEKVKQFGRDRYCITFPPNLDVTMKTVIIGACILVDYVYHEET